jgi:hypothetical protein
MEEVCDVGHRHGYKSGGGKPMIEPDESELPELRDEKIEKRRCGKHKARAQKHLSPAHPVGEHAYRYAEEDPGESRDGSNTAHGRGVRAEIRRKERKNWALGNGRTEYGRQACAAKKEKRAH